MKDSARFAIEAALHKVESEKAIMLQCRVRQALAKMRTKKRRGARDAIQRHILGYIYRKRWRDGVTKFAA